MNKDYMFREIMECWYCSSEEFIRFEEKENLVLIAYGVWDRYNFDSFSIDYGKNYQEIFDNNFYTPIYDYAQRDDLEDYFTKEQKDFLEDYFNKGE